MLSNEELLILRRRQIDSDTDQKAAPKQLAAINGMATAAKMQQRPQPQERNPPFLCISSNTRFL